MFYTFKAIVVFGLPLHLMQSLFNFAFAGGQLVFFLRRFFVLEHGLLFLMLVN